MKGIFWRVVVGWGLVICSLGSFSKQVRVRFTLGRNIGYVSLCVFHSPFQI